MRHGGTEPAFGAAFSRLVLDQNGTLAKTKVPACVIIMHCFCSCYGLAGATDATSTLAFVVPIKPVRLSRTPSRK
jgi:hypothetical protein